MTIRNQKPEPRFENRLLGDLKPFPLQEQYFSSLSVRELADLADDMNRTGLRERIEILPDGTIISGHQRVKAAIEHLDWESCDVFVRYDLEHATAGAKM